MDTILNSDEFTEVDGRQYLNPQVALDESNSFIDNLRATQAQQNQQIAQDAYNLGTSVPSVEGGLGTNTPANMSYFTSRYQTPQTNSAVANLRATAQAAALNQALQNEQEIWKKKYNDAYRRYQKSAYDRANNPTVNNPDTTTNGDVEAEPTDYTGQGKLIIEDGDILPGEDSRLIVEPGSGNIIGEGFKGDNPRFVRNADGSYSRYGSSSGSWMPPSVDLFDILTDFQYNGKRKTSTQNKSSNGFSGR